MTRSLLVILATAGVAHAQPAPGMLDDGLFTATITAEVEASEGTFGDPASIAPDLAYGVSNDLTVMLLHSTFGRTGFRGNAGEGLCFTDACGDLYDNVGGEAYYSLARGPVAAALGGGFHVVSFDGEAYAAKIGARLRAMAGDIAFVSVPSVLFSVAHRDEQPDRLFVPLNVVVPFGQVSVGGITGFKTPLEEVADNYEIAAGVFVSYTHSPSVSFAASWVHGKIVGGNDSAGIESRALQLWVTITRSRYVRYR